VKSGVCGCLYLFYMCFFFMTKPKGQKKLKRQEEFNVLIRSWLRITSLYVRRILDIR